MRKLICIAVLGMFAAVAIATTNEITAKLYLKMDKNYSTITRDSGSLLVQMAGQRYNSQILSANSNAWQSVSKGSVTNLGLCVMRDLSTNITLYVSYDGGTTTNAMLKPGEMNMQRLFKLYDVTQIKYKIDVAGSCDAEFTIIED